MTWPHQVSIADGCLLEPDLFFKFDGVCLPGPSILIGEGTFIGRGCEFNIRKGITVGKRAAIASGCKFVDHDHDISDPGQMDSRPGEEAAIAIGDDVWLGANVVVLKGVMIGRSAVVGAGAVVTRSIPGGEIWAGIPARKIGARQGAAGIEPAG
jgi:acetyltransferase-like isoleucine patch superfamily enzyme